MEINVLVVEDNPDDLTLMMRELKKDSFIVHHHQVMSVTELSKALENPTWDIAILDYHLPGFSAREAMQMIQSSHHDIPCIIVSGSIPEDEAIAMMRDGAEDYLFKDRLGRLGQAIRHALQEKSLRLERQKAIDDLKRSEAKFRAIYEHSMDAIILVDMETSWIMDVNPMVTIALHYEPIDLIGKPVDTIFMTDLTPEDIEILEMVKSTGPVSLTQFCRLGNGEALPFDVMANIIPWNNQLVMLITLRDVADRMQLRVVEVAVDDFQQRWQHEQELHALKTRFVSMVSHEFRNPLGAIQLSVDMLDRYLDRMDATNRQNRFNIMRNEIARMTRLIDDVLTLGQAESGALRFSPEVTNLVEFCGRIFQNIQLQMGGAHQMVFQVEEQKIMANVDTNLLRHILDNLLTNAIKYTPAGGEVLLSLKVVGMDCLIAVADSGIGIPKADQEHMFGNFFRAGNVGERKGTGLGLSITRQMVELHGGTITFESEENVGTTFIVSLPCT